MLEERLPVGALRYLNIDLRWRPIVSSSKDRILATAGVDGVINFWDPLSGKLSASIKPQKKFSDLLCLDYSRDASRIAAAGRRKAIKIYDEGKKLLITKLRPKGQQKPGHSNRIFAVKFDENGKTLISGSWDMTVKIWDVNSGTVAHSIYGPEINGDAIDMYAGDDLFLTGSHRSKDSLQLWSLSYGKLVDTIEWDPEKPGDSSLILSAQFEKEGNKYIVAGGSGRNEVRVFDRIGDKKYKYSHGITELPAACSSIDMSSNLVAVGCCDGICRLFERMEKSKQSSAMGLESDFIN